MLEVQNLAVAYGGTPVLIDVSLTLERSNLALVIGPNGHGKSTLLKAICGLIPKTGGSIIFDGADISRASALETFNRGISYVSEDRNLFSEMTVRENIVLGAQSPKARPKLDENFEIVLELFPRLKERLDILAGSLSGGEARMLAIGRGVMSSPSLLALDEPTLGMAPVLREEVFDKIAEISEAGMTILLVEQDFTHSANLTDDIHMLENGQIIFRGSKEDFMSNDAVRSAYLGV